jgi:hypothetical protein
MRLLFQTQILISVWIVCRHVREPLAAYIIPSCDAHNSEYIARKFCIRLSFVQRFLPT